MEIKITKQQLNKLINILKRTFINYSEAGGGKGYRFLHGVRVMQYCFNFLKTPFFKKLKLNREATLIAALFHDIGKIEAANIKREIKYNSYGDKYHEKIGAFIVDKFLKKVVKDIDLRKRISKIIEELNEKEPKFLETRLIKDADRLDNYGVIKIWRTVTYAQYQNRQIDRIYEYWEEEGRKKAKEELSPFYFKPIKSLAIKRFKKLDELIKEIKIENLGRDIKKNQRF